MRQPMHRRNFCKLSGLAAMAASMDARAARVPLLPGTSGTAIDLGGAEIPQNKVQVQLRWRGDECHSVVKNVSGAAVQVREVVLQVYRHKLPAETKVYGESFQMLTQTLGTLGALHEIGYGEQKHYRIPGPKDAAVVTNLLMLAPPEKNAVLLAYTSCHRFSGRFYVREGSISAAADFEGLALQPGESVNLEPLLYIEGSDPATLLDRLAETLNGNHPHRMFRPVPMGWCSWYSFARDTTAEQVIENLGVIRERIPALKYVQIDDGYQPAMGDWLMPGKSFGGRVQDVLKAIRSAGFEPALWVAPFIAAKNSQVLREHPEWFVQTREGRPMPAADVTFTGWGEGGWYCLDGTHPEVQVHLQRVFRTMREEWGCTYFKLDANFWGAVHGGRFHDPRATRIEAYRRGMEAVRRGAGDAFLLGCNHPLWPSLGLIDGSRSSGDIARRWKTVAGCMQESMLRNWQNGRLWWNDPDAVLLGDRTGGPMAGVLTEEEYRFHATSAYAAGGMILSGDDLTELPADRFAMLQKLVPATGVAAVFDDPWSLAVGRMHVAREVHVAVFNRSEVEAQFAVPLRGRYAVSEVWTGAELGVKGGELSVSVPAHGARLFVCKRDVAGSLLVKWGGAQDAESLRE